jgi:mannan polymerase complexes MNN9 subunit
MATYRALMAYMYEAGRDVHEEVQLDGVGTYTPYYLDRN